MAQCPSCGTTAAPDQAICLVCGADLGAPKSGASASGARPQTQATGMPGAREGGARRAARPSASALVPFVTALVAIVVMELLVDMLAGPGDYAFRLFRPSGGWL